MARIVPSQVVKFILDTFPWVITAPTNPSVTMGLMPQLAGLVRLVDAIPPELITLQDSEWIRLTAGLEAIRITLVAWPTLGKNHNLENIQSFDKLNPVTLIFRALSTCKDEYPSPSTVGLSFIEEADLRENLRTDIDVANRAFVNAEWKAATVLAGSVVEALLLWALRQRDPNTVEQAADEARCRHAKSPLEKWDLSEFITVAAILKVIGRETETQASLAREFRNLIHPGLQQRLSQSCTRRTALSALAAVEGVVEDLSR